MHVRELNVHKTVDVITNYLQYTRTFITTAESCEKEEEDFHSVTLGRNQKKFKRLDERNRGGGIIAVMAVCNVCRI